MKKAVFVLTLAMGSACVGPAFSQEVPDPWILRTGVANVDMDKRLKLSVAGQPVPGAALNYGSIYTAMVEIGRFIDDDWALVATVGFPPHVAVRGAGSIAAIGKLESTTFGPSSFTVQYQPFHEGFAQPYIGAGLAYMIIFSTHDAAIQQARLTNDLGPAVEVGSDFRVNDQWGLFAEVKKAFLHSTASGTLGGLPIHGTATLDPWVFSGGISFRF